MYFFAQGLIVSLTELVELAIGIEITEGSIKAVALGQKVVQSRVLRGEDGKARPGAVEWNSEGGERENENDERESEVHAGKPRGGGCGEGPAIRQARRGRGQQARPRWGRRERVRGGVVRARAVPAGRGRG